MIYELKTSIAVRTDMSHSFVVVLNEREEGIGGKEYSMVVAGEITAGEWGERCEESNATTIVEFRDGQFGSSN